ncbi:hypothetical protein QCA50_018539 [Cerrena zonata]|uniref:Cytochrome P450 n=1 Tax=Cerrena zonata TaxID=2478898 RepID=A0AAW0FG36_9APHY
MTTPIPSPPSIPFLGHAAHMDREIPFRSFQLLADQYGEIYRLNILTRKAIVVNSYDLVNELSDDSKFYKTVPATLQEVRRALGDGLFTAFKEEPNWGIAHRLLMPTFGTLPVRDMFDDMLDIAEQLILKWERFGPTYTVDPAEDFTRLTFDTIALTAMTYRFNAFYSETAHPFTQAMGDFLAEAAVRVNRPSVVQALMRGTNAKYEQDIKTMADLADEIIAERKKNPIDKPDLLNRMLYHADPKTGEKLTDDNIRYNLLTFLVAGHETTSGTLTFALYHIVKNPEVLRKLREEVDEVLGDETITRNDLGRLKYNQAVIRETLRLNPPASFRTVAPLEDCVIGGGKYFVEKDVSIVINSWKMQCDPKVWGEDALLFKPERMMDGKFEQYPPNAWQPFGYGSRGCIGRALAIQEAQICLACIIQKFDFVMKDPSYELKLKQTMTVKPKDFYIHAVPRTDKIKRVPRPVPKRTASQVAPAVPQATTVPSSSLPENAPPLYVLYGSNSGSSEGFAQRVASDAARYGFRASFATLDSAVNDLPTDGPIVIVTASFEGEPADNAAHFVNWLVNLHDQKLVNVRYAVFGCGNRDWARTYQKIPRLIDETLEQRGAQRLVSRGEGDASSFEFFSSFDDWCQNLWKILPEEYHTTINEGQATSGIEIKELDAGTSRATALRQPDTALGTVLENKVLTASGAATKRHIVIELPENALYRPGDYLAILPTNPLRSVQRAIARFGLSPEQQITLSSVGPTSLPTDTPITVSSLLSGYVELSQPATTRDLHTLSQVESSESTKQALQESIDSYEKVQAQRLSVLDLLEDHADIKLSFGVFLSMLPSMRLRQYSISSSPLWNPTQVSLTVSIIEAPSISGRKEPFLGVASTYIAGLCPGTKVQVSVRSASAAFHPPADPMIPMVMFCAGTGLAPMRGFLQDRAYQKKAGREVAKSLLFFGCRNPGEDYLYSESDLKEWIEAGVVDVRPAFSRSPESSSDCKYVQDRVWQDRKDVIEIFDNGAKCYTCGSRKVAEGVREVLTKIIKEKDNLEDEKAAALFHRAVEASRYATDIFD